MMMKNLTFVAIFSLPVLFVSPTLEARDQDNPYLPLAFDPPAKLEKNTTPRSAATYRKNQYGFAQRTGSLRPGTDGRHSIYRKNQYGFEKKTGSLRPASSRKINVYEKNKYGFEEQVGSMRKNHSGGYDVYRKNKYGFEEKVGSVK